MKMVVVLGGEKDMFSMFSWVGEGDMGQLHH